MVLSTANPIAIEPINRVNISKGKSKLYIKSKPIIIGTRFGIILNRPILTEPKISNHKSNSHKSNQIATYR